MRNYALLLVPFLLNIISGCGKGQTPSAMSPAQASDDEIFAAIARAEGRDVTKYVQYWHRIHDESFGDYLKAAKDFRNRIKYYDGDAGTTTIEQFVREASTNREAAEKDRDARRLADEKVDAERRAKEAHDDQVAQVKQQKTDEILNRYAAMEQAIRNAYYKKPGARTDAETAEVQRKLADVDRQRKAELKGLDDIN